MAKSTEALKSYLDLIDDCDSFPYDDPFSPPHPHWSTLYRFYLPNDARHHGLLLPSIVELMPWTPDFTISHSDRTIRLTPSTLPPSASNEQLSTICTAIFSELIQRCIDLNTFRVIHGQHSEPYPIIGANYPVSIERYAANLFGIISRGAHLTVYTCVKETNEMKIWVPRRAKHLFTFPEKLDTTVAGGVAAGEGPFECIVREAMEEASLPEEFVRQHAKAAGCISYIGIKDVANGGDIGETGLVAPDCVFVYDLEVGEEVVCRQNDEEVEEFILMSVEEVQDALGRGEFKTNSALVMIDFFVRHGVVTEEGEKDYKEILSRLHRRLMLPTGPERR